MKDKEARKDIGEIRLAGKYWLERLEELENRDKIFVKFCKKCKHDTAQTIERQGNDASGGSDCILWIGEAPTIVSEQIRCLNCGTLWEEKTVCKEIKEGR